jgi:NAD(P)-dependent dehydrogenase (short-subunit alcohol dehydrogenase family)
MNCLSYTLAKELERFGIRTNLLAAGAMTDMMRQLPKEIFNPETANMPTVEANAQTTLRLVVDESLNGQCFHVGQESTLPPLG